MDPLAVGLTVGKRSDGLVAVTPVPGIGGSDMSGGTAVEVPLVVEFEVELAAAVGETTASVALDEAEDSPVAVAVAVSAISVPTVAAEVTGTEASSS
jgi:hypothetical protein